MNYSFKYRVLNFLYNKGLLKKFNFFVSNNKNKIFTNIPIINGEGKNHFVEKEEWMNVVLNQIVTKNSDLLFVDVGVNIGQTLIKVKEIEPFINYIGFEPNPFCFQYVDQLIEINNIKNTKIVCCGISNTTSQVELLLDNNSNLDSSASILNTYRKGKYKKIQVSVFEPGNIELLRNIKIGYIKIDVEGAELEVLQGFKSLIIQNKPIILSEILPIHKKTDEVRLIRLEQLNTFLSEIDYSIYRIDMNNGSLIELDEIEANNDYNLCNYVFFPK